MLPDGYAMLMSPNKDETAVHGCHRTGDMTVRIHVSLLWWLNKKAHTACVEERPKYGCLLHDKCFIFGERNRERIRHNSRPFMFKNNLIALLGCGKPASSQLKRRARSLGIVNHKTGESLDTSMNYCQSKWRPLLQVAKRIRRKIRLQWGLMGTRQGELPNIQTLQSFGHFWRTSGTFYTFPICPWTTWRMVSIAIVLKTVSLIDGQFLIDVSFSCTIQDSFLQNRMSRSPLLSNDWWFQAFCIFLVLFNPAIGALYISCLRSTSSFCWAPEQSAFIKLSDSCTVSYHCHFPNFEF